METDWLLRQFGKRRKEARAKYAAFVSKGVGTDLWDGLRHQVFLGSESFVERYASEMKQPESLREVPRAQRRPFAKPLSRFESTYPDRREAMARAFLSGAYTMLEIAEHFGVHYSTVSRAVRWFEAQG